MFLAIDLFIYLHFLYLYLSGYLFIDSSTNLSIFRLFQFSDAQRSEDGGRERVREGRAGGDAGGKREAEGLRVLIRYTVSRFFWRTSTTDW